MVVVAERKKNIAPEERHVAERSNVPWKTWWFFTIRPQVLRIPKIPGSCRRMALQLACKLGVGGPAAAGRAAGQ